MRKLNALLHDVTVLNLGLILRLVPRYKFISLGALALLCCSVPYLFLKQVPVHQKKIFFKIYDHDSEEQVENTNNLDISTKYSTQMSRPEILAMVNNFKFQNLLSDLILDSKNFSNLDLRSPSEDNIQLEEEYQKCRTRDCYKKIIMSVIPNLYTIDVDQETKRMSLIVTTRSADTTIEIVKKFIVALEREKQSLAAAAIERKISQLQEQIQVSRSSLEKRGGFGRIASAEFLDAMIAQHNAEISNLSHRLNKESDSYNYQMIRLNESNNATSHNLQDEQMLSYENYQKINQRVDELRQNIAAINSMSKAVRTSTDDKVLGLLNQELEANELELKKYSGLNKAIGSQGKFINNQIKSQTNFEFDYKITAQQVKKLKAQYQKAKDELDRLYSKKVKLENELISLKPDLEYLKILEARLISVKLKKNSMNAFVFVDHYGPDVQLLVKTSFFKILIFGILVTAFLLFMSLIFIYMLDDKIYDEFEIEKCCENIPVIGYSPRMKN